MNMKYDKCIRKWNDIFSKEVPTAPTKSTTEIETLDRAIQWISNGTKIILDFGCGNGTMLFLCGLNGVEVNIGVDLSERTIESAKMRSGQMEKGEYRFIYGGIDRLKDMDDLCVDAVILSNIIDNLYPEDGEVLIEEVTRVLKPNGKVLIKLNSYITIEQIIEWDIKVIKDNLLDDGLILLNNTTKEWRGFFERKFLVEHYEDVYYPEHQQYNRMFWLIKRCI